MSTAFRGPLLFSRTDLPFDGMPFELSDAITAVRSGVSVGGNALYLGPRTAGTGAGWTLTEITAGGASVTQDSFGRLVLTSGTTDENTEELQYLNRPFRYSTTRKLACFARLKVLTAATTDALFGLCNSDAILIVASAVDMTDGIFFFKAATATDWTVHVRAASTSTTATTGLTIAADAYMIVGFTVVGGAIRWFAKADTADGLADGPNYLGAGTAIANTNAPLTTTDVFLSLGCGQEGGTTSRVLTVDWAFCAEWDV